jgi:molybdate/tungstate transport system ATP-binding protein
MIEASVRKRFSGFSLDASVSDAGFVCLAGENGSGKTTFLRIGLTEPDDGYVRVNGRDLASLPLERRGVVMVTPQSSIPSMDVERHLLWGAGLKGLRVTAERLAAVRAGLGIEFRGRVGSLSVGMRERVSLATALLSSPSAILVDEAFSNLHDREGFVSAFREFAAEGGIDVLFSSQSETDGRLAGHLYVMERGRSTRRF